MGYIKKISLVLLLILTFTNSLLGQKSVVKPPIVDRISLDLNAWQRLIAHPEIKEFIDHPHFHNDRIYLELDRSVLGLLEQNDINFMVELKDMSSFYSRRLASVDIQELVTDVTVPDNFEFGSMGGFPIFSEITDALDKMYALYPNLITAKSSIGQSIEGRDLWVVRIGIGSVAENPEVLYTALHHAREPAGATTLIYFMWWLLENYQTDPLAAYLIDNRDLYFIPVVNPDGYELNYEINKSGGGMWRKNARRINGYVTGVDLNRNYGSYEFWNSPNGGSSLDPNSQTYRGDAPFSEPETAALRDFINTRQFVTALNFHTYSNLLVYPYGWNGKVTDENHIFRRWGELMTHSNKYVYGTDMETVGYNTRGNSDDWMYGVIDTKPKIYTMTPEVGSLSDGFWPNSMRIIPLAKENVWMNQFIALVSGDYTSLNTRASSFYVERGQTFDFIVETERLGIGTGGSLALTFGSNTYLDNLPESYIYTPTLSEILDTETTTFSDVTLAYGIRHGETLILPVQSSENGLLSQTEIVIKTGPTPDENGLVTNYPNPFNAQTVIEYTVSQTSDVSLEVYNAIGQHIKTLFRGEQAKNNYSYTFDAKDLPSGIYFYTLTVNNQRFTQSMVLSK